MTLAGRAERRGFANGTGAAAKFETPEGVAIDGSGNLYVCDSANFVVQEVTSGGVVTTLAGTPGVSGSTDGTGAGALFKGPVAITVGGDGNIYVSDQGTIRKITTSGVVTTLAGSSGSIGYTDGTGSAAQFSTYITGLAADAGGTVYAADFLNAALRVISPSGVVTTLPALAVHSQAFTDLTVTGVALRSWRGSSISRTRRPSRRSPPAALSASWPAWRAKTASPTEQQVPGRGSAVLWRFLIDSNGNLFVTRTTTRFARSPQVGL